MNNVSSTRSFRSRIGFGFLAGFAATLIFHQLMLALLWGIGIAPFAPFSTVPASLFGIPAVLSLAFWGGVWGVLFAWVQDRFPATGSGYWSAAFVFGAVLPTLAAFFIVLPLKGRPIAGGWHLPLVFTALLINGAWGIGTGLIYRPLSKRFTGDRVQAAG